MDQEQPFCEQKGHLPGYDGDFFFQEGHHNLQFNIYLYVSTSFSNEDLQYLYRALKALRMLDHVKIALLDSFKSQFYAPFLGLVISPERTCLAYVLMVHLEYLWGGNAIHGYHSKVSIGGAQV